ncbi:MAG: hypothetical protein IKP60_13845 [Treponema sp.]|nr:hypothetical protein [Treponema sp.]
MGAEVDKVVQYRSFYEVAKKLDDKSRLAFYDAIDAYRFDGVETGGLPYEVDIAFTVVKPFIDADFTRRRGGAPVGNQNAKKRVVVDVPVDENGEDVDTQEDSAEHVSDEDECVNGEQEKNPDDKSKKKTPLVDREPKNDMEKVEKKYLENYRKLYEMGLMKIDKPVINWNQSRKLLKGALENYGLETMLSVLDKSLDSEFCIQKGYSLTMILSSGVLAGLINGNGWKKRGNAAMDAVDHPADMGTTLF